MLEPLRQGLPPIDPSAVSGSASCSLPARFEAVGGARKFTRTTLTSWDLGDRFDDVALVVSELVTNALRHALPADQPRGRHDPAVRLHLMRWTSRLVCAVRDPSEESPVAGEAPDSAESGRGLFLVESFSDSWGWHPSPALAADTHAGRAGRGKVVWALFRLSDTTDRGCGSMDGVSRKRQLMDSAVPEAL
ncbi:MULTISPECIES: ATP-binding protein [Streptomyces]|nr:MULTISPECIES: ATP-binding protein [Streptomyces]MDX2743753.1 ATP-binding protein [Streptomyces sp. NRRL_B-2557]MDX3062144.1 ATP-binding protein [Streptomyces sp. ND04-05B]WRY86735.1 ATP-binding protein [Streptomyces clavifer]WUC32118.1 ATP-binding protein [Streptomyces clavifer]GHB00334.1 ATP-binding protein [Streptomyces clavifer]